MAFRLIFAKALPEAAKSQFARFKIAVSGEVLNWTEAAEAWMKARSNACMVLACKETEISFS